MANNSNGKKTSQQGNSCHLLNVKNPTRVAERLKLVFHRIDAKLCLSRADKEFDVGLTLLDVSEFGAGVYASQMLSKGAAIELNIFEPRVLKVKGTIAWCVPAPSAMNSLVVRYPYRCGIQFIFESEVQRFAVVEFIQKIREKQAIKPVSAVVPEAAPATATEAAPTSEAPSSAEVSPKEEAAPAEQPAAEAPKEEATPSTDESAEEKKAA